MTGAVLVVSPGFLTTVQDLGRPGHAAAGVSASGAADSIALAIGNRLVGNAPSAPALEMTLVAGTFRFEHPAIVAITGADAAARVDGAAVPSWTVVPIPAGGTLACGVLTGGARAYLCVRGGLAVPSVLGSASTHLASGLGGWHGRALVRGDLLPVGPPPGTPPATRRVDPAAIPGYARGEVVRITEGPQASWFDGETRARFIETSWRVAEASDRMGLRFDGPALARLDDRELVTEGVALGAIQIPADGKPIVLFVEHQTTGGYPKIANVASVDLARVGQLRPRDEVRFAWIGFDGAVALAREQAGALRAILP